MKKTFLITGASSGLGHAMAIAALEAGHDVLAGMRSPADAADAVTALRASARGRDARVDAFAIDVTSDASVARAFEDLSDRAARVDVVVNNAGISAMGVLEGFDAEQLASLLDVNAIGAHRVNRAALPLLRAKRGGLLVHVSTGLARIPMPCFGAYCASKAALESLAESYRLELGPEGIDSVIIEPGPYPTQLGARALLPRDVERVARYGALAELPSQMMEGLSRMFAGPGAPDPREVANVLLALAALPHGERPLRTVVGPKSPLDELNALTDRLQRDQLRATGLDALVRPTSGHAE